LRWPFAVVHRPCTIARIAGGDGLLIKVNLDGCLIVVDVQRDLPWRRPGCAPGGEMVPAVNRLA
jgi:hypothetical protein